MTKHARDKLIIYNVERCRKKALSKRGSKNRIFDKVHLLFILTLKVFSSDLCGDSHSHKSNKNHEGPFFFLKCNWRLHL